MKYKNFKPVIHNYARSFLSSSNYLDGAFIVQDIMKQLERLEPGGQLTIQLHPADETRDRLHSERVRKSLLHTAEVWNHSARAIMSTSGHLRPLTLS